jgi:hypothetical protein
MDGLRSIRSVSAPSDTSVLLLVSWTMSIGQFRNLMMPLGPVALALFAGCIESQRVAPTEPRSVSFAQELRILLITSTPSPSAGVMTFLVSLEHATTGALAGCPCDR